MSRWAAIFAAVITVTVCRVVGGSCWTPKVTRTVEVDGGLEIDPANLQDGTTIYQVPDEQEDGGTR